MRLLHKNICDFRFIQRKSYTINMQVIGLTPQWKQHNASLLEVYLPASCLGVYRGDDEDQTETGPTRSVVKIG